MIDETYNGWSNHETWLVKLWMGENYEDSYWIEQAEEALARAPTEHQVVKGIWTPAEYAAFNLADTLTEQYSAGIREVPFDCRHSVFADLLTAALARVDWDQIARSFVEQAIAEAEEAA